LRCEHGSSGDISAPLPPDPRTASALLKIATAFNHDYDTGDYGPVAVVMFLVLAATATTTVVIALGLIRRLFTPDHRLVYLPVPPITETATVSAAAATVVQGLWTCGPAPVRPAPICSRNCHRS
jgi:hypothetical protein